MNEKRDVSGVYIHCIDGVYHGALVSITWKHSLDKMKCINGLFLHKIPYLLSKGDYQKITVFNK